MKAKLLPVKSFAALLPAQQEKVLRNVVFVDSTDVDAAVEAAALRKAHVSYRSRWRRK